MSKFYILYIFKGKSNGETIYSCTFAPIYDFLVA